MLSLKQKEADGMDMVFGSSGSFKPVKNYVETNTDGHFSLIENNFTLVISSDEDDENPDGKSKVSSIASRSSGFDEKSQNMLPCVISSSFTGITSPVNAQLNLRTDFLSKSSSCQYSLGQSSAALSIKPNSSHHSSKQSSMSDEDFDYETDDTEENPLIIRLLQDVCNSKAKKSIFLSHSNPAGGELNSEPLTENPFIDMSSSELDKLQCSFMSSKAGSLDYEEDVLHSSGRSTVSSVSCKSIEYSTDQSINFNSPQKMKKLKSSFELQSESVSPDQDCSVVFETKCFINNSLENSASSSRVYCKRADNPTSITPLLLSSTVQDENSQNAFELPSMGITSPSSTTKDSQLGIDKVSSLVNTSAPVCYGDTPELDSLHLESSNAHKPAERINCFSSGTVAQYDDITTTHRSTSAPCVQQERLTNSLNETDGIYLKLEFKSWLNEIRLKSSEKCSSLKSKCKANPPKCKGNPPSFGKKPVKPSKKIDPYFGTYRAPKRIKPRPYVTNQMYTFLERNLASQYGLQARLKAEEFVTFMCAKVEAVIKRKSNYHTIVKELCKRMVDLKLVKRQIDFHIFIEKYLPTEFRVKAIPCFGCKAGPPSMSSHDLFRNISQKK